MKVRPFIHVAALSFASAALVAAQTPQTTPRTTAAEPTVTAKGCLKAEKDVPGRQPNVAERAGIAEDYILVNAKLDTLAGSGKSDEGMTARKSETAGVSARWKHSFKIEGIDDDELQKHLGHQIEVTGKLKQPMTMTGATADHKVEHLREIHATSIKMIAAQCSAPSE